MLYQRATRAFMLCLLLMALLLSQAFAQDATWAWDEVAADFNFPTVANATLAGTFASEYYGSDFESDFPAALAATAELVYSPMPEFEGDETLRESITENWPDS